MTSFGSPEIDRYVTEHTTEVPPYLADLPRVTAERMGSAGMISGPVVDGLLQTLIVASGARRVLEIGTFTGFSALMMAEVLPDDGVIITCDRDPKAAEVAREYFAKSPHGHKIEQRLGVALDTIRSLEGPFDFVFIDADKINNAAYYERALELALARRPDRHRQRALGRPRPRPGRRLGPRRGRLQPPRAGRPSGQERDGANPRRRHHSPPRLIRRRQPAISSRSQSLALVRLSRRRGSTDSRASCALGEADVRSRPDSVRLTRRVQGGEPTWNSTR